MSKRQQGNRDPATGPPSAAGAKIPAPKRGKHATSSTTRQQARDWALPADPTDPKQPTTAPPDARNAAPQGQPLHAGGNGK
jgi:hypothetical protein